MSKSRKLFLKKEELRKNAEKMNVMTEGMKSFFKCGYIPEEEKNIKAYKHTIARTLAKFSYCQGFIDGTEKTDGLPDINHEIAWLKDLVSCIESGERINESAADCDDLLQAAVRVVYAYGCKNAKLWEVEI